MLIGLRLIMHTELSESMESDQKKFGEFHGGYLNFGWWEKTDTYLEAAETLVQIMAKTLGLNNQSKLLDVACGMGAQDVYIHRHFGTENRRC